MAQPASYDIKLVAGDDIIEQYEVDAPDMVGMGWPQPDDRSIFVIEPPALLVPLR